MALTGNSSPNNREFKVPNLPTSSVCDGIMTTRTTNILRQATRPAGMDFSGTWKVYSEENLEDFLKVVGAPQMIVKMRKEVKPVLVIEQNGKDFTYTMKTPVCTKVHSFSIGKESEITAVDGRKFKCTVREENGKLIAVTDKFTSVREIQGDEMVETVTAGAVTFISRSKRV
ncbi:fatty acid-binding protein 10-A, liver basic [Dicentrarchus labrax]|uniref:fatty acid-binding protein 10-A, liver basic n=1 Tax=Dicentrarchus labrax TaxID=13489 RepID=UPI0021F6562F|nr:fatty acid-binding protein 10-A, liver basic [Dicentrarchus labrax]